MQKLWCAEMEAYPVFSNLQVLLCGCQLFAVLLQLLHLVCHLQSLLCLAFYNLPPQQPKLSPGADTVFRFSTSNWVCCFRGLLHLNLRCAEMRVCRIQSTVL